MESRVTRPLRPKGHRQALRAANSDWARRRVALGLSQRYVQEQSGISRGLISMIESGRLIPKPHEAAALLRVYAEYESKIE
jgi:predicted transcriptional regulator